MNTYHLRRCIRVRLLAHNQDPRNKLPTTGAPHRYVRFLLHKLNLTQFLWSIRLILFRLHRRFGRLRPRFGVTQTIQKCFRSCSFSHFLVGTCATARDSVHSSLDHKFASTWSATFLNHRIDWLLLFSSLLNLNQPGDRINILCVIQSRLLLQIYYILTQNSQLTKKKFFFTIYFF